MKPRLRARIPRGLLLACLSAALASANVFAQEPSPGPALNKYCPVLTGEEADPGITTVYQGRTIAFCCDSCRAKFEANPERYLANLPALEDSPGTETPTGHGQPPDSGDAEPAGERPPWLARMHPVIVHFPVAGIPLALLGFLARVISRRPALAAADVLPLALAAMAAVAAVITGDIAHDTMRFARDLHAYVHWHQYAGTTVMVLVLVLAALRLWRWNRLAGAWLWLYGVGLAVATALVAVTGYLGGSLVFGPDHFGW